MNDEDGLLVVDLTIPQGADRMYQFPLVDAHGEAIPSMTGYTAKCQARNRIDDAEPLVEWNTDNGGILLENSTLSLNFKHAETDLYVWEKNEAIYDIKLTTPFGDVIRVSQGSVFLNRQVTRG